MKTIPLVSLSFFYCWASLVVELPQDQNVHLKLDKEIKIRNIITFCIRFNLRGSTAKESYLFSSSPTNLAVLLKVNRLLGFVTLNEDSLVFKIPKNAIKPYSWYHFCFTADENTYQISVEGESIENIFCELYVKLKCLPCSL